MLLLLVLFVQSTFSEDARSNVTMSVKLEKRVFEYETVKGDRMAQYVNDELRVRMLAANKDPARLVASLERRELAEAAIEPLLPDSPARDSILRSHNTPHYSEPASENQTQFRLYNLQLQFAYRSSDRLKVLDDIIRRNIKSLRFRMAFAFAKLDQLRFQMRLVYSKYRQLLHDVTLVSTIRWYTIILKMYIDIVYMVERIYKFYDAYMQVKSKFGNDTAVEERKTTPDGTGKEGKDGPSRPLAPSPNSTDMPTTPPPKPR